MGGFIISFSDFDFPKEKIYSSVSGFDDELRALEPSWVLCLEEYCALEDLRLKVVWIGARDVILGSEVLQTAEEPQGGVLTGEAPQA